MSKKFLCDFVFPFIPQFENRELTQHTVQHTRNRNISLIPRPPYFISIFPSEDGYRSISLIRNQRIHIHTHRAATQIYIHTCRGHTNTHWNTRAARVFRYGGHACVSVWFSFYRIAHWSTVSILRPSTEYEQQCAQIRIATPSTILGTWSTCVCISVLNDEVIAAAVVAVVDTDDKWWWFASATACVYQRYIFRWVLVDFLFLGD